MIDSDTKKMAASIRMAAMSILARREHSQKELEQKLTRQFGVNECILTAIDQLQKEGLQSDERFAEAFTSYRQRKGQGPVRILHELKNKGVHDQIIELYIDTSDECWIALAKNVWEKRFGSKPENMKERARQIRFLQYRGFTLDQINRVC